ERAARRDRLLRADRGAERVGERRQLGTRLALSRQVAAEEPREGPAADLLAADEEARRADGGGHEQLHERDRRRDGAPDPAPVRGDPPREGALVLPARLAAEDDGAPPPHDD